MRILDNIRSHRLEPRARPRGSHPLSALPTSRRRQPNLFHPFPFFAHFTDRDSGAIDEVPCFRGGGCGPDAE